MTSPRTAATDGGADEADRQGMGLLAAHVPLSLLIDLAEQRGPHSSEILHDEQPTLDELAWLASHR